MNIYLFRLLILLSTLIAANRVRRLDLVRCRCSARIFNGSIDGEIIFTQKRGSNDFEVIVQIKGLSPGNHAIHVHEKPDLGNGCNNTGPHFNPWNKTHGCPEIDGTDRHQGDIGNFYIRSSGFVRVAKNYPNSKTDIKDFVDRGVVIHADVDDCGKGNETDSKINGHSGKRVACGLITGLQCKTIVTTGGDFGAPGKIINIDVSL